MNPWLTFGVTFYFLIGAVMGYLNVANDPHANWRTLVSSLFMAVFWGPVLILMASVAGVAQVGSWLGARIRSRQQTERFQLIYFDGRQTYGLYFNGVLVTAFIPVSDMFEDDLQAWMRLMTSIESNLTTVGHITIEDNEPIPLSLKPELWKGGTKRLVSTTLRKALKK